MNAPIYATAAALARGCVLEPSEAGVPSRETTARWLERVRPQDFGSRPDTGR